VTGGSFDAPGLRAGSRHALWGRLGGGGQKEERKSCPGVKIQIKGGERSF